MEFFMEKNVLITGASRGIGRAAAKLFAREGYGVAINYSRSETEAKALAEALRKDGANACRL